MKTLKQAWLAVVMLMLLGRTLGLAQETGDTFSSINLSDLSDNGVLELSGTNIPSFTSFTDDQLNALVDVLDAIPTVAVPSMANGNTMGGTFWSLQNPGMPPLPADTSGVAVWPMADGSFLLNDWNFDYTAGPMTMGAMDDGSPPVPDAGDGGTNYTPAGSSYIPPDYGTNLWIAQWQVATNLATGIASNTIADVEYEIQVTTNLAQDNWATFGFIYGSEITNWTALIPQTVVLTNNGFLRLRSWESSDGTGLPTWWEQLYGLTNVDGNAQDAAGDGWTIFQKFQMGLNPNVFTTPITPQDFSLTYDPVTGAVSLNWVPSPGSVTSYTLEKSDAQTGLTTDTSISASATSYQDSIAGDVPISSYAPLLYVDYMLTANYGSRGTSGSAYTSLEYAPSPATTLFNGPLGRLYIAAPGLPTDVSNVVVYRQQNPSVTAIVGFDGPFAENDLTYSSTEPLNNGYFNIPASSITNGIWNLPDAQAPTFYEYLYWIQTVRSNGIASGWAQPSRALLVSTPFLDFRQQLKDNLRFLLRAADDCPFAFRVDENGEDWSLPDAFACPNTNYVCAGFYGVGGDYYNGTFEAFEPIHDNCFYSNFAFSQSNLNDEGLIKTGCIGGDQYDVGGGVYLSCLLIPNYPTNYFNFALFLTNGMPIPSSQLGSSQTQWILSADGGVNPLGGGTVSGTNIYGLTSISVECAYVTNSDLVVANYSSGQTLPSGVNGVKYNQYASPVFTNEGYYFTQPNIDPMPEQTSFSTASVTPTIYAGVGTSKQIAGYAKLGIQNGYSDVVAYLGQYFANAYAIDTNGNTTANTTGVLSPYGNFLPTVPGPVALVTMPDIDTGDQGTCMVYCVSLQLDANHDGTMDTSLSGADATSPNSPYQFWCNNNFDRSALDTGDNTNYEDDVEIDGCPATPNVPTPDCNYSNVLANGFSFRAIPTKRDLEDFARLWVSGLTSNLVAALPSGSTITLNWGDQGYPNPVNPTIDLFVAADSDGGIGYLTNETVAATQTNPIASPYIGRLSPGGSIQLNPSSGWYGNHFIWCGVSNGTGGLNLTIADSHSNILAQTTVYIQIMDIKQMYERWTVGDNPSVPPTNVATLASEDLPAGVGSFQFSTPQNTNTPYILLVHGWNCPIWIKDRFAETGYKRLYWQGYHGRMGELRWPTYNGFEGTLSQLFTNIAEKDYYDDGEYQAWQSAPGLLNLLTNLNAEYPNHVYMMAHSMGNVVAGEALRLATQEGLGQVVNTYVASQAAISAHTYDTNVVDYTFYYPPWSSTAVTPNIYGNWFRDNMGHSAGQVINFFNINDYALSRPHWQLNQLFKPDHYVLENGDTWTYGYSGSASDPAPWNNFYKQDTNSTVVYLNIVTSLNNRYETMAFAAQSWTTALGATFGVGNLSDAVDLSTVWFPDPTGSAYTEHFWHSAQFRGDNPLQRTYWTELLGPDGFDLH